MKTRVLDSWAILEWISARRPADRVVARLLAEAEDGRARLLMSAINAGEVYYFQRKHHNEDATNPDMATRSAGASAVSHRARPTTS